MSRAMSPSPSVASTKAATCVANDGAGSKPSVSSDEPDR